MKTKKKKYSVNLQKHHLESWILIFYASSTVSNRVVDIFSLVAQTSHFQFSFKNVSLLHHTRCLRYLVYIPQNEQKPPELIFFSSLELFFAVIRSMFQCLFGRNQVMQRGIVFVFKIFFLLSISLDFKYQINILSD